MTARCDRASRAISAVRVVAALVPLAAAGCSLLFDPSNLHSRIDAGGYRPDAGTGADAAPRGRADANTPPPCRHDESGAAGCRRCGDGVCNGGESSASCPEDCGADCGDGVCNGGESSASCPEDCGTDCGDGVCNGGETPCNCKKDCRADCGRRDCCDPHRPHASRRGGGGRLTVAAAAPA